MRTHRHYASASPPTCFHRGEHYSSVLISLRLWLGEPSPPEVWYCGWKFAAFSACRAKTRKPFPPCFSRTNRWPGCECGCRLDSDAWYVATTLCHPQWIPHSKVIQGHIHVADGMHRYCVNPHCTGVWGWGISLSWRNDDLTSTRNTYKRNYSSLSLNVYNWEEFITNNCVLRVTILWSKVYYVLHEMLTSSGNSITLEHWCSVSEQLMTISIR